MYTHWYSDNGVWAIEQELSGPLVIVNRKTGDGWGFTRRWGCMFLDREGKVPQYVINAAERIWFATR